MERARALWHPSWLRLNVKPWEMAGFRQTELAAINAWLKQEAKDG